MTLFRMITERTRFLSPFLLLLVLPWSVLAANEEAQLEQNVFDAKVQAGYRAVSTEGEPGRAAEYSFLRPGPTFGVDLKAWKEMRGFSLIADYLNEADYSVDADLNYKGMVRFSLSTESMYHNLDHLPFDSANRPDAFKPTGRWIDFEDVNPGDRYFVEVEQGRAALRVKPGNYPAHVNLEYWRLERSGRKQLRFLDHAIDDPAQAGGCNQCHVRSRSRKLNRVTEEVKGGIDAHLGPVDVVLEQLYREFRDREPVPVDSFSPSFLRSAAGDFQHDEDPDSRLIASTLKLHTSLSGGVVGAASFTIGKRENQSDLSDVRKVESETDFKKTTGDLTWIPMPSWTFNFRYRLLDMDNSNSGSLISDSEAAAVTVPDNIELTHASYAASGTYRPWKNWTFKGDFERRDIHRGNVNAATALDLDPVWEVPKDETIDRFRLGIMARPFGGNRFKVNTWYQYLNSDDPAYASSAEESHTLFTGAAYSSRASMGMPTWGLTANLKLQRDANDGQKVTQITAVEEVHFRLGRDREEQNLTAGAWLNPTETVMLGVNYGFLRSRIMQDLLFGTSPNTTVATSNYTIQDDVEYSQQVQTVSATVGWQILKNLKGHGEVYHIRSFAEWDPDFSRLLDYFNIGLVTADSSELREISRLDIRQKGLRVGLDWQMTPQWGTSFNYTFDDYEDRDTSTFDGSAQTYMVSLARTW